MSESLTEFLLARIAEDEAIAKDALPWATGSRHEGQPFPWSLHMDRGGHPARVLAECEAKRRIVVLHGKPHRCRMWDFEGVTDRRDPCDTLRALALPYADHDDYREEWKP